MKHSFNQKQLEKFAHLQQMYALGRLTFVSYHFELSKLYNQ